LEERLRRGEGERGKQEEAEGEAHAEEDRKARENAEVRNNADNLAYQCEKQLKDLGDKIPADKKGDVEKAVEKVRETLKGSDVEAIKTAYTDLQNQFQGISADLYKNAGATAEGGGEAGAAAGATAKKDSKSDVVDAEFEVVDEDKKKNA
jgi:molecular chaperone DnaK